MLNAIEYVRKVIQLIYSAVKIHLPFHPVLMKDDFNCSRDLMKGFSSLYLHKVAAPYKLTTKVQNVKATDQYFNAL